jgi:hypothetical protein
MQVKSPPGPSRIRRAFLLRQDELFDVAWALLAIALTGEGLFRATLLTWLQVEGMTLDFLYNVFLLDFALETA